MTLGIHTLDISDIEALLHFIHGTTGGSCADYASAHQPGTGTYGSATPTTYCSPSCRT